MIRRTSAILVTLAVALAACSGEEPIATTTTPPTSTTTTSTLPSTTTTAPVDVSIEGAPPALVSLVNDFYTYASGGSDVAPRAPDAVLAGIGSAEVETAIDGEASVATFADQQVAVIVAGTDTFLAVEDNAGWRIVGGDWPSVDVEPFFGEGPRHLAVIGSDARPGEDVSRSRADSIHFVALDGEGSGAVVGLPRDSFVPLPGGGRTKITNSLSMGGPEMMMGALGDLTDLPLEGYVLTGFAGFVAMFGEVLGGASVEVPFAINDRWAHVSLGSGLQTLDGAEALGFARARKTVPGGDFTRSEHQGVLLLAAAGVVKAAGPMAIPELMELSEPHLVTDLTPEQLLTFSAMAVTADLEDIPNLVAPGSPGSAGGASVVFLHDAATDLWADLADGTLEN